MPRKIPPPVRTDAGCLEWQGSRLPKGYGKKWDGQRMGLIHRITMEKHLGRRLGREEVVMHVCDNPPCFEISHLRLGSAQDNIQDMVDKGRASSGNRGIEQCKHGHWFDEANTYVRPDGKRNCRACNNREQKIRYRARKQGER